MDYSQLLNLQKELDQKDKASKTAISQAKNPEIPKSGKEDIRKGRLPENQITGIQDIGKSRKEGNPKGGFLDIPTSGKPDTPKSGNKATLKVPKYYTQLALELQEEIKIYAIRHKIKHDYEVVIQAIEEFFKKRK